MGKVAYSSSLVTKCSSWKTSESGREELGPTSSDRCVPVFTLTKPQMWPGVAAYMCSASGRKQRQTASL